MEPSKTATTFVYVTDERGFGLTEHAVAAAVVTQKSCKNIIIFCAGFTPPKLTQLQTQAQRQGFNIEYRHIPNAKRFDAAYIAKGAHAHVTSASLLKMAALSQVSTEFDRALYLDGDVLLMRNIDLEIIDFEGKAIAAVYDIARSGGLATEHEFFQRCAVYGRSPHYFNSGVIAANFDKWDLDIVRRYDSAVIAHQDHCDYSAECSCRDQCAWNQTFERVWKRLPMTCNFQACAMFTSAWKEATIRHYVGPAKFLPFKPWRNDKADTLLLTTARSLMGLPPIGFFSAHLVQSVNTIRNRSFASAADAALARLEYMYLESM